MTRFRKSVLTALLLATAAVLPQLHAADAPSPPGWTTERVNAPRLFGLDARSLAIDAQGVPHVAYGGDRLYLASRFGDAWQTQVIDPAAGVGEGAGLVIDGDGVFHVVHRDVASRRVLLTSGTAGAADDWTTDVVAAADAVHVSFAVGTDGAPHVAFLDGVAGSLSYATRTGDGWAVEVVPSSGDLVGDTALGLDAAGRVHIAYQSAAEDFDGAPRVHHATNASGAWATEVIAELAPSFTVETELDLGVDSAGHVHVVYDADADVGFGRALWHATNAGGGWTQRELDGLGSAGSGASLALGAADELHVAYVGFGTVSYLTTGGGLTTRLLGIADGHTSLALDPVGRVHIVHGGEGGAELRYLRPDGDGWVEEEVDRSAVAGRWPALAVDASGGTHVLHRVAGDLVYEARDGSGNWTREVLVESTAVELDERGGDLLVDADGTLHATYSGTGFASGQIYATKPTGEPWSTELVDGSQGDGISRVALDATGRPHVLYAAGVDSFVVATRGASGWSYLPLDHRPGYPLRDFDVAPSGAPQVLGRDPEAGLILHTSRVAGVWVDEVVARAGVADPTAPPEPTADAADAAALDVDSSGGLHIVYATGSALHYVSNSSGSWVDERVDDGGTPGALDIRAEGDAVYASYRVSGCVKVARRTPHGWAAFPVDAGAETGALAFPSDRLSTVEDRGELWLPVIRAGVSSLADTTTALALDARGGAHVAYDDAAFGDLKYARPGAGAGPEAVSVAVVGGTATEGEDFDLDPGPLRIDRRDTGVQYARLGLVADGALEPEESVVLELAAAGPGTTIGPLRSTTVRILDAAAAPVNVPGGAARSFLHITSVESPSATRAVVRGILDTGPEALPLGPLATLTVGRTELELLALRSLRGRRRYAAPGAVLTISPSRRGTSRSGFRLVLDDDVALEAALFGEVALRLRSGLVDASGAVEVELGRYRRRRPRWGALLGPALQVTRCRARVPGGGRDTLTLTAALPGLTELPEVHPDVTIRFGNLFEATIAGEDLRRRRRMLTFRGPRGGVTSLTIDYATGTLRLRAVNTDLGTFVPDGQPVVVGVDVGEPLSVLVRMSRRGKFLTY